MKASVLIPIKNGGELLLEVVQRVLAQVAPWPFELVVLDSGSTDGSLQRLMAVPGVRVQEIPASEFNHGSARNRLANAARGEFLVFLTQDALPVDEHWLSSMIEGMASDTAIAGGFGRHVAHRGAGLITQIELDEHFRGFGSSTTVYAVDSTERFEGDVGYRQFLHFFSNNNSCIRKVAWESIPFPDVNFAEDQAWALAVLRAGWKKVYIPAAVVAHSHEFGVIDSFKRAYDEASAFQSHFGYVLQPDLRAVARNTVYLARRNHQWMASRAEGTLKPFARIIVHLTATAKLLGQYAGSHNQKIPTFLRPYLSRDLSLRRE